MRKSQLFYLPFKRLITVFGSYVGYIICFSIFWWWIFPINIIATKGHPIFVQKRIGKNKRVFGLIKFRYMRIDANPNLAPLDMAVEKQASMDTWFGPFSRKSSLDETLQLFNIFIGQMSFIGPRPGAAKNEENLVKLRESFAPSAYMVKSRLGGYAQLIIGRDHNPNDKAKFDSEYVKK